MSCDGDVCGTGGFTGPKPGDPDNFISLRAATVFGGIEVTFSYPATNPFAVAFVHLHRSLTPNFTEAAERALMSGNVFFDRIETDVQVEYYYWVQIVSVNGTTMDPIGPASAYAVPRSQQTLDDLAHQIDESQLAIDLQTRIHAIDATNQTLAKEISDRLIDSTEFDRLYADVQNGVTGAMTYMTTETQQRVDGHDALARSIDLIVAANKDALAAIYEEKQVRVTETGAMASDIKTVESALNGDTATGQIGLITQVGTLDDTVKKVTAEYFVKLEVNNLLGGFGLYNDGATVDAGFNVDRFWIGRPSDPQDAHSPLIGDYPFIVSGGVVYMKKAFIRDADIDTLKLAGEAVTVPIVASAPDKQKRGKGEGTFTVINEGWIHLDQDGMVYALATMAQGFNKNDSYWSFQIRIDGQVIRSIMGRQANDAPSLSATMGLTAGTHHIEVCWSAADSVIVGYCDLFMMGVKK